MRCLILAAVLLLTAVSSVSTASLPSCEQILADANKSRDAKISAALLYYHGKQMGKRCVAVDYVKAITMLNEAGDTRNAASLVKDLSAKANTGNPKAASALKKLEKLGLVEEVRGE